MKTFYDDISLMEYSKPSTVGEVGFELRNKFSEVMSSSIGSSMFMQNYQKLNLHQQFEYYKSRWVEMTKLSSNFDEIIENDYYKLIIRMGWDVIPFIIIDLAKTQNFWFYALQEITGQNPIKSEHAGDIELMTKDWLNWANITYNGIFI